MKLIIGSIVYGGLTAKYLPDFFQSLKNQSFKDFKISVIDNSETEENENKKSIQENYAEVDFNWVGRNLGFAKAYNILMKRAMEINAEYFLAINPDTILEAGAIERMIGELEDNSLLGSVSPKILKWDFENRQKTKLIDSCGIKLLPGLKFADIGQGEIDRGQYDNINILGPSGAAALYRMSALKKVKNENGYFDESMFMYKEDCDLAYRLFLAGYKSKLAPGAVVYHDRTAASEGKSDLSVARNRKNKSRKVNEWSFLNQQIIFWKFWRTINWKNKLILVFYQIKVLIYILFFEPYLLKQLWPLYKIRKTVKIY